MFCSSHIRAPSRRRVPEGAAAGEIIQARVRGDQPAASTGGTIGGVVGVPLGGVEDHAAGEQEMAMRLNAQARLRRNELVAERATKEAAIHHLTQQLKYYSGGGGGGSSFSLSSRLGSFFE